MIIQFTMQLGLIFKRQKLRFFLYGLLLLSITPLIGQNNSIVLSFQQTDNTNEKQLLKSYALSDTTEIYPQLHQVIDSLRQVAFLAASIDSLVQADSIYIAYLYLGNRYNNFQIENGNIEATIIKKIGLVTSFQAPINYFQLKKLQEALLTYAENNGYPFAAVRLENVQIDAQKVIGKLYLEKGKLIRLDALKTEGDAQLNPMYLANYLNLKKGNLYQKDKIIAASTKLKELPFIQESRSPIVQFKGEEAIVNLFLNPRKANRFDFLIGVLPNNQETGKVLITADIEADFHNQFGKGERIQFDFEQLRPETQQLNLAINYPYILNTPLGTTINFGLFKRDSTYRDLIWNIGLQYLFEGNNYLKAFSKNIASALLTIDKNTVIRNKQLPENLDLRYNAFGVAYQLEKLDYRFNPRSGWLLQLEGSAGFKTIKKNNKITDLQDENDPNFNFAQLYDDLDLNTFQYQLVGQLDKYFPLQKRGAFKLALSGATTISKALIFNNEQFRIGGNQLLRGFDEASIFATTYVVGTLEYRYLIGQNSFFSFFGDTAYVNDKTNLTDKTTYPIGLGAGMNFETKAGIFGISYALGKVGDAAFEFRTAKVHFGFVSLF